MQWHNPSKKNKLNIIAIVLMLSIGLLAYGFYLPTPKPLNLPNEQPISIPNINSTHLFGIYTDSLDDLPKTTLPLTLEGTLVPINFPSHSYAIISGSNHPAKLYHIGDTVPGNAILTQINQHAVALNNQGRSEKLELPIEHLN